MYVADVCLRLSWGCVGGHSGYQGSSYLNISSGATVVPYTVASGQKQVSLHLLALSWPDPFNPGGKEETEGSKSILLLGLKQLGFETLDTEIMVGPRVCLSRLLVAAPAPCHCSYTSFPILFAISPCLSY